MTLLGRGLQIDVVDKVVMMMAEKEYGDLSGYGLVRPRDGPFHLKKETGRSPVIDVGTVAKIKSGAVKVYTSLILISLHTHAESFISVTQTHTLCVAWSTLMQLRVTLFHTQTHTLGA